MTDSLSLLFLFAPATLLGGYLLDLLIGDPAWLPHPIRCIGWLISKGETGLRRLLGGADGRRHERLAGTLLVLLVLLTTLVLTTATLVGAWLLHPALAFAIGMVISWQCLAARCLGNEASKVAALLQSGDLPAARQALSMIVGRDTAELSEQEVEKAVVETVAENTSDGVTAPAFYLALGGPLLGLLVKAVNTMDSMLGYRNERYLVFGRSAALLDDVVNFLPSRLTALTMIAVSPLLRLYTANAWRIWRRDRLKHASPNSAQCEAACAGALGIRLGGGASYKGIWREHDTLGDPLEEFNLGQIRRAVYLMFTTSTTFILLAAAASFGLWTGAFALAGVAR